MAHLSDCYGKGEKKGHYSFFFSRICKLLIFVFFDEIISPVAVLRKQEDHKGQSQPDSEHLPGSTAGNTSDMHTPPLFSKQVFVSVFLIHCQFKRCQF